MLDYPGKLIGAAVLALASLTAAALAGDRACPNPASALGVSRVVEIDTRHGPHFGEHTKRIKEPSFLKPKEVVLTFDDGPMPGLTRQILDTLDQHCTRATWFSVGRMAIAYPDLTREIVRRGHTLGSHTWSHPLNIPRLRGERPEMEIEKGIAAISMAAGEPIAPFFRFPGLNDSPELLAYLQSRGIATFTVDVISDDSYIASTERLIHTTLSRTDSRQGGIMLFHDIKATTARALPTILAELKRRGYSVVHMVAKAPVEPKPDYTAELTALLAKTPPRSQTAAVAPAAVQLGTLEIAELSPDARTYTAQAVRTSAVAGDDEAPRVRRKPRSRAERGNDGGGWTTTVRRSRRLSQADGD